MKYMEDGKKHFCGIPHRYYKLHHNEKVRALINRDEKITELKQQLAEAKENGRQVADQLEECRSQLAKLKLNAGVEE